MASMQDEVSSITADEAIADTWGQGIGAEIMGRGKFGPQRGPWTDQEWRGWWSLRTMYPWKSQKLPVGLCVLFIAYARPRTPARSCKQIREPRGEHA